MNSAMPAVPLEALAADDPREIGDYRLLGRLGSGGMGVAFLAEHASGWAVVKRMWPHLCTDASNRSRVQRELEALSRIDAPEVVRVLDQGLEEPVPWIAMDFVPGVSLESRVASSGPLPDHELRELAAGLARAVSVISDAGMVHRDLKPANIMLSPSGPVVIDLGVADLADATRLTSTGMIVGSAAWMAPEQVTGEKAGAATDVHAWGLSVLYAATGTAPFSGDTTTATLYQVLHHLPEVPRALGRDLAPLIAASLAKDPAMRPTVRQLVEGTRRPTGSPRATVVERADATAVAPAVPTASAGGAAGGSSGARSAVIGAVAALAVVAIVGAAFLAGRAGSSGEGASGAAAASSAAPSTKPKATVTQTIAPAPLSGAPAPTVTVTEGAAAPQGGESLFSLDPSSPEFAQRADEILCSGEYLPEIGRSSAPSWPVLIAQRQLNLIYDLPPQDPNNITVNGVFGPITERLTGWFQYDSYATVTGRVGPETWQRFRDIRCSGAPVPAWRPKAD